MVYTGTDAIPIQVKGEFIKQTDDSNAYYVDFSKGFVILDIKNNVEMQWVKNTNCLFIKGAVK